MLSHNDLFVQLSENRLQQSLDRLSAMDTRALGLLGLIAVLMAGLWAVYLTRPEGGYAGPFHPAIAFITLVLFVAAMICAGLALLLTTKFDSPDLASFYAKYYGAKQETYPAYFAAVINAIDVNNRVIRQKSLFLLLSTVSLFFGVLVIIL